MSTKWRVRLTGAALTVLVAGLVSLLSMSGRGAGGLLPGLAVADPPPANVPKANCGPNDHVESGLQGQTTIAERLSLDSQTAYNCNTELVGQYAGEGASWQLAWFDDCAYYDTANNTANPPTNPTFNPMVHPGTIVVDASDPTNPQMTANLTDRAMLDPWESLKVNKKRKLLGATKGPGGATTIVGGFPDSQFSFYDIQTDCRHPKLLSDVDVPGHIGHAGDFAPDGKTYYGTSLAGHFTAMDITDPSNPQLLLTMRLNNTITDVPPGPSPTPGYYVFHDITISDDGNRLYAANFGNALGGRPNGLVIVDVSDIQNRLPNPQIHIVSTLFWADGSRAAQVGQPVRIKGKPYVVFADENGNRAASCPLGWSPFGMARIIDISDETNPTTVSTLMLEINDPVNCTVGLLDQAFGGFSYDSHYCTVDNPNNAKLAACGHFASGLRVFDIRDPSHPKEIAYYKPPALGTVLRPGSQLGRANAATGVVRDRTTDWATSNVRFVHNSPGDYQIWFTSQDNGFQIVRLTDRLLALTGLDKFEQDHPGNQN